MAKYLIRPPFSVHRAWFEDEEIGGRKRRVRREQSYFYGPSPIELSNDDAIAHMHKLEPADQAAHDLFMKVYAEKEAARAARQAQDGNVNSKSIATQVTEGVMAAMLAAGLIKAKEAKG